MGARAPVHAMNLNPISWLTGKVALYVCGALLGVVVVQAIAYTVQGTRLEWTQQARDGWKDAAGTYKKASEDNAKAANAWKAATQNIAAKLAHALTENLRVDKEAATAVATAEAKRIDAERTLDTFMDRFAKRTPTCAQALNQMEAVCGELSDY